ncbi:MAG TPA: methyltransferase domain-containing protein [Burkholderiales bacterium]|nr:methyltransferase domain-containing protein [Burkholderiales bacterium]
MSAGSAAVVKGYVLDNAAPQSPARMQELAYLYDSNTFGHLAARGLGEGWRCLEIGAGGGSVARWMSERVGSSGRVVVTDIDPRLLGHLQRPNVEVRTHDIARDSLEEEAFDLAHARLVLEHVPARAEAFARIVRAVRPGGWVVIEDFEGGTLRPDPAACRGEQPIAAYALMREVLAECGVDLRYGRRLPGLMRAAGLVECGAEGRAFIHQPNSPGLRMLRANLEQLRGAILGTGRMSEAEFAADLERLKADDILVPSPILWTVWGRRP